MWCESASRHFQPREDPSRGLLRDYENFADGSFAALARTPRRGVPVSGGGEFEVGKTFVFHFHHRHRLAEQPGSEQFVKVETRDNWFLLKKRIYIVVLDSAPTPALQVQ